MNDDSNHNLAENGNASDGNIRNNFEVIPPVKSVTVILLLTALFVFFLTSLYYVLKTKVELGSEFLLIEGLMLIPAILYLRFTGYSLKKVFRLNPISSGIFLFSIIIGLSLIPVLNYVESMIQLFTGPEWLTELQYEMAADIEKTLTITNAYEFIIIILGVVISAGVCEEIIFRGLIQQSIEKYFSVKGAVIATALFFAVFHPIGMLTILILAFILGFMSWRSNSIYPSIIIHIMNNGYSLYALNNYDDLDIDIMTGIQIPFYMFAVSLAVLIVGLWKFTRLNERRTENVIPNIQQYS